MSDSIYIAQDENRKWNGADILSFSCVPEKISTILIPVTMDICQKKGVLWELILESQEYYNGHAKGKIILRSVGYSLESVSAIQRASVDHLVSELQKEEINIYVASFEEVRNYVITLSHRQNILLCIPGEDLRNIDNFYVPGGYDAIGKIDLSYISALLSGATESGLGVQVNRAAYYEEEYQLIQNNVSWFARKQDYPNADKAKSIFQIYENMGEVDLYFVAISLWGNDAIIRTVLPYLKNLGFQIVGVTEALNMQNDYLLAGHRFLPLYASWSGHVLSGNLNLPKGAERLNFLTNKEQLMRIFGQKAIKQIKKEDGLLIGTLSENQQDVKIPWSEFSKHLVIAGMSGSGKTTLMFQILLEMKKKGIPFLIVEPTKNEYRNLKKLIPELKIYTPGRTDVSPIMFNPFLPPKGITLEQYLPSLSAAFKMAFTLTTPLDVIFGEVLRNCYVKYGWRNDSTCEDSEVTVFGMHEFICAFKDEVAGSSYDPESKQNLLSGGAYRFLSLLNNNPYLFDTDQSLDIESLLNSYSLIELEAIDNAEQKSLILALLLQQLKLVIRNNQQKDSRLKNIVMIDEAHVLLGRSVQSYEKNIANPEKKLQEDLLNMVKENRAYGTGMIFADQSLSVMREFFENSNIKIIMKMESMREREMIFENLRNGREAFEKLPELVKGEFFLTYEGIEKPLKLKSVDFRKLYAMNKDIADEEVHEMMKVVYEKPFAACSCRRSCNLAVRTEAEFIARRLCQKISGLFNDEERLNHFIRESLDDALYQMTENEDNEKRLMRCARMMTLRMIRQKASVTLDEEY